eukprot:6169775-Pyramimonas_sp.AAC.2
MLLGVLYETSPRLAHRGRVTDDVVRGSANRMRGSCESHLPHERALRIGELDGHARQPASVPT